MSTSILEPVPDLPIFLNGYGLLYDHFEVEMSELQPIEKGRYFTSFVQRLVPHTEIGRAFEAPMINPKHSYDGGVDLTAENVEGNARLYIQSKYRVSDTDDFDIILSKFQSYVSPNKGISPQQLPLGIPLPDMEGIVEYFMVVTLSPIKQTLLARYEKSSRPSLRFYQQLLREERIVIVDGNDVLKILRETYRKSFILPTNLQINGDSPFIKIGNVFVGVVSALEIKRLHDEFGDALFLENIREYLGPTSALSVKGKSRITVNEAIAQTLDEQPHNFLSLNNGIVIRAGTVRYSPNELSNLSLDDASIVNGCQTTVSIVHNPDPNCRVLVKIVEVADSWNIAEAANFQNRVEQIELKLARYVRPQKVRAIAQKYGVKLQSPDGAESAFAVIDQIYQNVISMEEFRSLFIGFFSRQPTNIFSVNYTQINTDVIDRLFEGNNSVSEEVYEVVFQLSQLSRKATEEIHSSLKDDKDLQDLFQRFWKESTAPYRAFLTILATCSCAMQNIFAKQNGASYEETVDLFRAIKREYERDPNNYIHHFSHAFDAVAFDVLDSANKLASLREGDKPSTTKMLTTMRNNIERADFENLYNKTRLLARPRHGLKKA